MTVIAPLAAARPQSLPAEDPLRPDEADDAVVVTTRRALCRLAVVAAETGQRFERESLDVDPVAWLLAPRRLFGGGTALDACLQREHFGRAGLLHGLSIGMDADPAMIDELAAAANDGVDDVPSDAPSGSVGDAGGAGSAIPSLWSATLAREENGLILHVFHSSIAVSRGDVARRLALRFGAEVAAAARIRRGLDLETSTVELVPPVTLGLLLQAEQRPFAPASRGLEVTVERRIAA